MVRRTGNQKSKSFVLVTSNNSFPMIVREMVRKYRWNLEATCTDPAEALTTWQNSEAEALFIDDDPSYPAIIKIRYLMTLPLGSLAPIVCFSNDNYTKEISVYKYLNPLLAVTSKPLSVATFVPAFDNFLKNWQSETLSKAKSAIKKMHFFPEDQQMQTLLKIAKIPGLRSAAISNFAMMTASRGDVAGAEKALLTQLKSNPKDLIIILALAHLYNLYSSSSLAEKLLLGARKTFGDSLAIIPDLIQARLFLNKFDGAEQLIRLLIAKGQISQMLAPLLAVLLLADGRKELASYSMPQDKGGLKKISKAWNESKAIGKPAA